MEWREVCPHLGNQWRKLLGAVGVVALMTALASLHGPLQAQEAGDFSLNLRGGVAVPTGSFGDVNDPGVGFGAGVKFWTTDRVFFRGAFDVGLLSSDDFLEEAQPEVDLFQYIGGAGIQLTETDSPFYILVNAGAGVVRFSFDAIEDPVFGDFSASTTEFAVNFGGELGYRVSDSAGVFLSPQANVAINDDTAWVWPFTAGIELIF